MHSMYRNRAIIYLLVALLSHVLGHAQEGRSIFNFLNLPTSSHALALGGKNITLVDDDASLAAINPALMANVTDRSLCFNFLTYMKGSNAGSLNYVQNHGKYGNWGVGAQFVGYGGIIETDLEGNRLGTLTALDMNLYGGYSYMLSDRFTGGVYGKFLYSHYAGYTSIGLAVDLGINYYDEDHDLSISTLFANLGGQVRAFGDVKERLPIDMQIGISKGLTFLPVRLHLTLFDMFQWKSTNYSNGGEPVGAGQVILSHIDLGADILLWQDRIWVGLGYNFRRGYEMKAAGSSHAAGLTLGAGLSIKNIKFGIAYGNYHYGAPTLDFTLAYSFPRKPKQQPKKQSTQPDNQTTK